MNSGELAKLALKYHEVDYYRLYIIVHGKKNIMSEYPKMYFNRMLSEWTSDALPDLHT